MATIKPIEGRTVSFNELRDLVSRRGELTIADPSNTVRTGDC